MPFQVKVIQVDGGAEFEATFKEERQKRSIKLFALPPRSPKLNGAVERAHRTHAESFLKKDTKCQSAPLTRVAS